MIRNGRMWLAAIGGLALATGTQAATLNLPRPGQVGFSGQAQYGALAKTGEYGSLFGNGPGYSFHARYRMRYERAIGMSFERHGFDVRDPSDTLYAPTSLTLITTTLDVYQLFGTRTATVKMLSASLGLSQGSQKLNDGETRVGGVGAGDAFVLGLGAGLERFVWQSWAVDAGLRYFAHFHQQKINHDVQLYAGFIFYAGY